MWEHYRKTFTKIQLYIFLASGALYFSLGRRWETTLVFFAMMQVGSLFGALWAKRLKRKLQPRW